MGILDALTGAAGHQAADNQRLTLANIIPNLATTGQDAYRNAGQYLQSGALQARNDLGTGYGASTGAVNTGAGSALGYLGQGTTGALDQLGQARGALTAGGGAYAPLSALADQYGRGASLYADSLGINGAGGNQRAVDAFQAGPGYDFARQQGLEAITRHANAAGGLGGNSLRDTIAYGQGLANQEYGKYQDRLAGFSPLQLAATQGAATGNAGINSGVANTYGAGAQLLDSSGRAQAGVATGQGNSLADLARQYYGTMAGNNTSLGAQMAGNEIGGAKNWQDVFGSATPQWNNTFKMDADASNAASANSLNLGMNLAKLLAGGIGGSGGFSNPLAQSQAFQNNSWGW